MQSIAFAPKERKDLIRKMKRESKPSRRLRMHIILLAGDGRSPTEIARTLFCSRTTVYSIVDRFVLEGGAAFHDRKRRGPVALVNDSAQELIEGLSEEALPAERGWLRSRWSCKLLALELFKDRALVVSRETVRRLLKVGWTFVGEDLARLRHPKTPNKSEKGSQTFLRCCVESAPCSRTKPGWRPIPKWAFAGCEKAPKGSYPLRGPTAKCGSPGRWSSRRVASTG